MVEVGDTVRLKIGGPTMIVDSIIEDDDNVTRASCVWFDEEERREERAWPLKALEKYEENEED